MTGYEKELLALAVEEVADLRITQSADGVAILAWHSKFPGIGDKWFNRNTLADALTALLRDLGVEVPERPSAGQVEQVFDLLGPIVLTFFRNHPTAILALSALLEGGEA